MLDHEQNNLYFKSKTPNIELPDYYLKNCEKYKSKTVVEYKGEYMVLSPNDWFLIRTGTQANLPFKNYVPFSNSDWLHKYRNLHTPMYELDKFVFKTNIMRNDVFKSGLHYQMFKQMDHEWFNLLKSEFDKTYFRDILQTITQIKERVKLIPDVPKVDYFHQFGYPIQNIKVVFISEEINDKILSDFLKFYPGNEEDLIINGSDKFIFLVAALTSLTTAKNAHVELWKPFVIQVINKLDNYFKSPVLFVLVGKETHYLQDIIKNNPFEVFDDEFEVFKKIFKLIEKKYNKKWIEW